MKRATREWVEKAEGDFAVAGREMGAAQPVFDAVCFHAQQCVEKYLKALLEEHGIVFPLTHDLVALGAQVGRLAPGLGAHRTGLTLLTTFAVAPRYPGTKTGRAEAEAAMRAARDVRGVLRTALGL